MIVVSRQAFFEAKFRVLHYEKKMVGTQCKWFLEQRRGMNWKPQNWCKLLLLSLHTKQINLLPPWVSFFLCLDMFRFLFFRITFLDIFHFFSFPLIQWRIWHWHFLWLQSNIKIVMRWKVNQNNRSVHMHFVGRRECIFEKINWSSGCWC